MARFESWKSKKSFYPNSKSFDFPNIYLFFLTTKIKNNFPQADWCYKMDTGCYVVEVNRKMISKFKDDKYNTYSTQTALTVALPALFSSWFSRSGKR